ncbi:MAG TPA: radical SAM protein [Planctomycetaceae bacterium]|nr:radical SAM protein [Planctomycetaceae bacterium]
MSVSLPQYRKHPRTFRTNRYVYPVVSRRSGGLSIGINLNPDKVCNFDCIYCQVDRRREAEIRFVDDDRLLSELDATLGLATSGELFELPEFRSVPEALHRLNDIAFSGDGEPTTFTNFDEIVAAVADRKQRLGLTDVKLVLITNASMFHRPAVQRALRLLDQNNGEIWAKLETGTEEAYRRIARTRIPFQRVLQNITDAAKERPLIVQSLFMSIDGSPPPEEEIEAYCQRLRDIVQAGGRIRAVQVYTVARPPAEAAVTALSDDQLRRIAQRIEQTTGLLVHVFGS